MVSPVSSTTKYSATTKRAPNVAILVPCYNEAATIAKVVADFQSALPQATIYVYDNNSSDGTPDIGAAAGAVTRHESQQGKGNVVRRMFADIEADIYIMVDGDDTYDAHTGPTLIETLVGGPYDMVNTARVATADQAYRPGHRFGNWALTALVQLVFGKRVNDMLSGYRAFSRRFVKTFPALSQGFEIETELTVHALELRMPIVEIETPYRARPPDSASKLATVRDGFRILWLIGELIKEERPLPFFAIVSAFLALMSVGLAIPLVGEYLETGLVPRFPTAILSTGMMILAFLALACGLILDTVTRGRHEMKRMGYLALPASDVALEVAPRGSAPEHTAA